MGGRTCNKVAMAELPERVGHVASMPKTSGENIEAAKQLKAEGNARLKAGDFANARKCYAKMVLYLRHLDSQQGSKEMGGVSGMLGGGGGKSPAENLSEEEKVEVAQLVLAMNSNMSLCYLKLEKYNEAAKKATEALERDPGSEKLLLRRGKAFYELEDWDHAKADLEQCERTKEVERMMWGIGKAYKKAEKKQKKQFVGFFDKLAAEEVAENGEAAAAEAAEVAESARKAETAWGGADGGADESECSSQHPMDVSDGP